MLAADRPASVVGSPTDRIREAHRRFIANGGATAPDWLRSLRASALARFEALGFPTTRQEEWRFTNLGPLAEFPFAAAPAPEPGPALGDISALLLGDAAPHRLVFVNGRFAAALSRTEGFPDGVRVESLAAALRRDPELVRCHLGSVASGDDHPFRALNAAFLEDGAFVYVPARVALAEPVQVLFLGVPGPAPAVSHPRSLVVIEREATAAMVEEYVGAGPGAYWTNAVTEIVAGDGSRLDYHRVQRETEQGYHVASTHCRQRRDSHVTIHPVAFGGGLARHDLGLVLDGPGAYGVLNGLYVLRGTQHADHHTVIDHRQPHCESHEYFNGVLDESSRSVFTGRIVVRPGAQRTDSKQTNNNLLLSGDAHADSQPQLEIYADDVKCTHGSTTGPLDERHLFYLRSRGLDAREARQLLTYGFATEIIARMEIAPLREQLDRLVRERVWGG
jgi:Fe-S cluster assembly protein SufD